MITVQHLYVSYTDATRALSQNALNDISFSVSEGESIGIIGPNGAGKSTLLNALIGLVAHSGTVLVDDVAVEDKNLPFIRKKLGLIMQNSDNQLFMPTVIEDILFGVYNSGLPESDAKMKVNEIVDFLGISSIKDRFTHQLSGGEKRMVAMAGVLAMDPSYLLLDEPSNALDPYNRRQIIRLLQTLPTAKLIASHDLDLILDTCQRTLVLFDGKIIADGETETVLSDRALLESCHLELPLSKSSMISPK